MFYYTHFIFLVKFQNTLKIHRFARKGINIVEGCFMEYNDEKILSINDYEIIAKAYANELKKRGFMVVQVDAERNQELVEKVLLQMGIIKSHLFMLGGFLNTSQFYSLNDRQIKKMSVLFDISPTPVNLNLPHDKTKCFLSFLSFEFELIKNLLELTDKSNYENQLKQLINARLAVMSQILSIKN